MSDKERIAELEVVVEDAKKAVTKPIGSIPQPEHPSDKLHRYKEMLMLAAEALSRAADPSKALDERDRRVEARVWGRVRQAIKDGVGQNWLEEHCRIMEAAALRTPGQPATPGRGENDGKQ